MQSFTHFDTFFVLKSDHNVLDQIFSAFSSNKEVKREQLHVESI